MKRLWSILVAVMVVAGLTWACDEPTAPRPSLVTITNACDPIRYPNYGGIWAVTLEPSFVQVDSSVAMQDFLHRTGKEITAYVWRDWASAPGNQYYCVDTTASYTKISWNLGTPTGIVNFLPGSGKNSKALTQGIHTGTAHPFVYYTVNTNLRDTTTVVSVP